MNKKYFGTDGIRGKVGTFPINSEFALKLGWAVGMVFSQHLSKHKKKLDILIGKDTRISGYVFEAALQSGLLSSGANIHLVGPLPTPGIAYLTKTLNMDVGIVISASHNSFEDNGIKFFDRNGHKISNEIEKQIERLIDTPMNMVSSEDIGRANRIRDAGGRYIEFCKSIFPFSHDLEKFKIVLDCANGAGYHVAPAILEELGAELVIINNSPNGLNINHKCGSTSPENLAKEVLRQKADVGIALDGDGDRVIMVDEYGEILDGDDVLFAIFHYFLITKRPCEGVVGTLMTNYGLEKKILEHNVAFIRTAVGDKNISTELRKNHWQLGGESSGHILCDERIPTGDGIIAALHVLACMIESTTTLSQLRKMWDRYPSILLNISSNMKTLPDIDLSIFQKKLGDGRIVVRPSGTEPKIRILVEGPNNTINKEVANDLELLIKEKIGSQ